MKNAFHTNVKSLEFQSLNNKLVVATAIINWPVQYVVHASIDLTNQKIINQLFDEYPYSRLEHCCLPTILGAYSFNN